MSTTKQLLECLARKVQAEHEIQAMFQDPQVLSELISSRLVKVSLNCETVNRELRNNGFPTDIQVGRTNGYESIKVRMYK
jgi:hypothetical protein